MTVKTDCAAIEGRLESAVHDVDELNAASGGGFRDAAVTVSCASDLTDLIRQSRGNRGLNLHHVRFSKAVSMALQNLDDGYSLRLTLFGSMRTIVGDGSVEAQAGDFTVVNPGGSGLQEWEPWSEHLLLFIKSSDIERAVGEEIGDRSRRKVLFDTSATSAKTAGTLFDYIRLLDRDMHSSRTLSNPTTARLSMEMAASLMLRLLPHDKQRQIKTSQSPATPYYVRRALDYADERFGEAISLRDMAGAAGVCSRTLDKGFRRFCDKSPMEHLRSVRLDNARTQLMQAQDPVTTVSSTARLCGFRHLGRFAEYYARQFGELPSQTLGRQQDPAPRSVLCSTGLTPQRVL